MTNTDIEKPKTPLLSDSVYNAIKQAAQYWLPALGTLYAALGALWGFPYVTQVVGTIAAVDVFLGVILGVGAASYNKSDAKYDGAIVVASDGEDQAHALQLSPEQFATLPTKDSLTLKVQNVSSGTPPEDITTPPSPIS